MRIQRDALLALPCLLSALVAAIPSPAPPTQQQLEIPTPQRHSRWRHAADSLIESIWGDDEKSGVNNHWRQPANTDRHLPAPTLARYGNDVVLRFSIGTAEEAQSLAEAADTLLLDVWEFAKDWADIRLSKDVVPSFLGLLPDSLQRSHTPILREREFAQAVHDTYPTPKSRTSPKPTPPSHVRNSEYVTPINDAEDNQFFLEYQPLEVIEQWMRLYANLFGTHVELITVGKSYQDRDILGLRVGHPSSDAHEEPKKRKTVIITGGMHAREWISTSTVNYVAYNLFTSYGAVDSITELLDEYDFVFVPTLNPDGYVYTWETDRLWRKNRQQTNVRFCQGIDLDRAFGFEWNGLSTAGNPCSENFAGEHSWEAVEAKVLADWAKNQVEEHEVELVGFIDFHSYSQQIMYPYGYSCDDTPPGQENLEELAIGLEKAIRTSSSQTYEVMPACEGNVAFANRGKTKTLLPRIQEQGGSALDWFYHEMNVRYAYQIKLRDRGTYGFLLPKENIVPTGKEILDAVLYFGQFLVDGYPKMDIDGEGDDLSGECEEAQDLDDVAMANTSGSEETNYEDDLVFVDELSSDDDLQWELRRRRKR